MFVRRKLVGFFAVLILFVVVATVDHYFYLEPGPREHKPKRHPQAHEGADLEEGEVPKMHLHSGAAPGEITINENTDLRDPVEVSVADEVRHAVRDRRVGFAPTQATSASATIGDQKRKTHGNDKLEIDDSHTPDLNSDGTRYIPRRRVVHLDLKGAPPKISYFKTLFPLLQSAGATHLLLEYEDMFPFSGPLKNLSAHNAYTKNDVQNLLSFAAKNNLEIIPLVQTFGHLELALKQEEFKDLREVSEHPQSICPSKDKSWTFITEVIDQVLEMHPKSNWLHIGCDEVYQLGQCSVCSEKIARANNDPDVKYHQDGRSIFLEHVHRVGTYVRESKHVIPIIWDDMLRTIPPVTLLDSGIGDVVEPMIWVYIEDVDRFVDPLTWNSFGQVFTHVWTASAYKGAFGERLYATNIQRHVGNHLAWQEVMRRESQNGNRINFRGIVLTGWSRYDHFAVLCELLPVSIPSLVLNLVILNEGGHTFEATRRSHRLLQCNGQKTMMTPEELLRNPVQWDMHRCRFPGSNLFSLLSSYDMNKKEVESLHERITKKDGWMSDYSVRHHFASPSRVMDTMRSVHYLPNSLRSMEAQFKDTLLQYFDSYTTDEWIEQHILPLHEMVNELLERSKALTDRNVWPRRPLVSSGDSSKSA